MRTTVKCTAGVISVLICLVVFGSPPPGKSRVPYAPDEALDEFKKAVALFEQGLYEQAIQVTLNLYRRYGDVRAVWFPTWVRRIVKELPDPKDHSEVLRWTVEGRGGHFLYTMVLKGCTVSSLLMESYFNLGRYEEARKWADFILARNPHADIPYNVRKLCEYHLARGFRPPKPPPKNTWLPLPLRFLEEDYFILVPLDEACKVLGIPFRYKINPKTGKKITAKVGEKGYLSIDGRCFARNVKGEIDDMAYAPFEEDGEVWVPFYWLAKQAGIKGWEVRGGKIYVAPVKDRRQ